MKKIILLMVLIALTEVFVFADRLYVRNGTGEYDFYEIYVSYGDASRWGNDLLGTHVLGPGETLEIDSPRPLNSVNLDFLIIDEDGDTYTLYDKRVRNGETVVITLDDLD